MKNIPDFCQNQIKLILKVISYYGGRERRSGKVFWIQIRRPD
jgi:hypothetical protein